MTDSMTASPPLQAHGELPPVAVRSMDAGTPDASQHPQTATNPAAAQPLPQAALRGQKMQLLFNQMLARGTANQVASATLLPLQFDVDTWNEVLAMQVAVVNRLQQQQQDWARGLTEIVQDYSQIRLANTLSKFIEQEYNLGAQIGALMTSQVSQFMNLVENVQVDYGYWIAQKQPKQN